jgi:DNA-binding MarR family transcriptional regulator
VAWRKILPSRTSLNVAMCAFGVHDPRHRLVVERCGRGEEVMEYHVTMVAQPGLQDKDFVLWTLLLAEVLNGETLEFLRAEHPDIRYSHGFLFQQLVEGPRPVGEVAANLGVTSQAVSKMARELEGLGYVERVAHPGDARVRLLALTARGEAAIEAGRTVRDRLNRELAAALGEDRVELAARTLKDALGSRGAMAEVEARRVRSAQGLRDEGR